MKRIISLSLAILIVLSCLIAGLVRPTAASSVMKVSSSSVGVGDQLTVNITVNGDAAMYAVQFALSYDPAVLEFVSGDSCSGGAGVILAAPTLTGATSGSFKYVFKAIKAGTSNIATADMQYSDGESIVPVANQGASITVTDATLSDNANITALTVGGKKVAVSASKTSYNVTVGREITDCAVYVTTADKSATVSVKGNKNLKVGDNTCTITVTAPSGAQKVYTVIINRSETETSSEEEEGTESAPLDTEVDGTMYTVAASLESVELPVGFTTKTVMFNEIEVTVATDEKGEYEIYYLTSAESEEYIPYTLNKKTNKFEILKYMKQGEKFYIFAEVPEDYIVSSGFYDTHTRISNFDVVCYYNNDDNHSDFYYIYCYNGEEYGFYRYDAIDGVLQRYPEIKLSKKTVAEPEHIEERNFAEKFASLTTNAKIVVIGIVLMILLVLALGVLLVFKVIAKRNTAEMATNLGYDDFDNINFDTAFTFDDDYTTEEEDVAELDFGEDSNEAPNYLVDDETENTK